MQNALREKVFDCLVDAVRDLGRGFAAQHFGLDGASKLGSRSIACAHLIPTGSLQQGQGDGLKMPVAEGRLNTLLSM